MCPIPHETKVSEAKLFAKLINLLVGFNSNVGTRFNGYVVSITSKYWLLSRKKKKKIDSLKSHVRSV